MECQDVYKLMNRYIDGEITPEEEKVLEFHLGRCKDCREEFSFLKEMNESLNTLELSHDFTAKVMAQINEEKKPIYKRWMPATRMQWISTAAAIFLAIILITPLFSPKAEQELIISSGQVQTEVNENGEKQVTVVDGEIRISGLKGMVTAINSKIIFETAQANVDMGWWGELKYTVKEWLDTVKGWFGGDDDGDAKGGTVEDTQ